MDLVDDYSDINTAIKKTFECINETFGKNEERWWRNSHRKQPEVVPEESGSSSGSSPGNSDLEWDWNIVYKTAIRAGVRPSEFWDLTPAEYNLIIEGYKEIQKEFMYRDIRNAYYTGCFAQVEKPSEFYDKIVDSLTSEPQTAEDMFNFLKSVAKGDPSS